MKGNQGPAALSGPNNDTVTVTGAGTVVIQASQAGNATYAAAPSVTQSFTVTASAHLSFSQWEVQSGFFTAQQLDNSAYSGSTATPENDGVPNLLKYLYDINPMVPMTAADRAALPVMGTASGYLTLTYRQYAGMTGITIHVQTSPDLKTWTAVSNPILTQTGTDSTTGDPMMQIEVPSSGTAEFIRLNVTMP